MAEGVRLLAHHMFGTAGIFASGLDQLRIRNQLQVDLDCPWRGVGLRVVNGDAEFHRTDIAPPETLCNVQSLGLRTPFFGIDPARSLNPIVSTTIVSPSHLPTE